MKLLYGVLAAILLGFCFMYIPNLLLQPAAHTASSTTNLFSATTAGNNQSYQQATNASGSEPSGSLSSASNSTEFSISASQSSVLSINNSITGSNSSEVHSNSQRTPTLSQELTVPVVMLIAAFLVALVVYFAVRKQF